LIGSKGEQALNRSVREQAPGTTDFTGQTSLADAVALIRRAAVVVTNDSGAMHIAAALGRPAVSIFGPTNPVQVGPYGQPGSVVRLDLPCSPCNYRLLAQCPNGHACMRDLPARMVMDKIRAVLAHTRSILPVPGTNARCRSSWRSRTGFSAWCWDCGRW
jgi:heptosyltransferase-2